MHKKIHGAQQRYCEKESEETYKLTGQRPHQMI